VEPVSPDVVTRAHLAAQYRGGLMVSEVSVSGPAYRKLFADQTILLAVLNPGPRRELRSPADLDAVLAGLKHGDTVTFLVYDLGQDGSARAVTLEIGQ
jgi:hypothetical protein